MTKKNKKPSRKTSDVIVTTEGYRINVSPLTVDEFRDAYSRILLGHLQWGHTVFPHLRCWKSKRMQRLLSANTIKSTHPENNHERLSEL